MTTPPHDDTVTRATLFDRHTVSSGRWCCSTGAAAPAGPGTGSFAAVREGTTFDAGASTTDGTADVGAALPGTVVVGTGRGRGGGAVFAW